MTCSRSQHIQTLHSYKTTPKTCAWILTSNRTFCDSWSLFLTIDLHLQNPCSGPWKGPLWRENQELSHILDFLFGFKMLMQQYTSSKQDAPFSLCMIFTGGKTSNEQLAFRSNLWKIFKTAVGTFLHVFPHQSSLASNPYSFPLWYGEFIWFFGLWFTVPSYASWMILYEA